MVGRAVGEKGEKTRSERVLPGKKAGAPFQGKTTAASEEKCRYSGEKKVVAAEKRNLKKDPPTPEETKLVERRPERRETSIVVRKGIAERKGAAGRTYSKS